MHPTNSGQVQDYWVEYEYNYCSSLEKEAIDLRYIYVALYGAFSGLIKYTSEPQRRKIMI